MDSRKNTKQPIAGNLVQKPPEFHLAQEISLFKENMPSFDEKDFIAPKPYAKHKRRRYVTREANLDQCIDPQIFAETQIKRFFRGMVNFPIPLLGLFFNWFLVSQLKMKLDYFSEQEDKCPLGRIYVEKLENDSYTTDKAFTLTHLGHATQQFSIGRQTRQTILTDPVFNGLAPLFYPSMTHHIADCDKLPDTLPDVIVISHNHRDHVDETSLRGLVQKAKAENRHLPILLVPKGDASFFKSLGFADVREFVWHNWTTIDDIAYIAVPADHRSGRTLNDSHSSLVTGWVISHHKEKEITYFAGDTARLNDTRMLAVASNMYALYEDKLAQNVLRTSLPKIINIQPAGPNYTRKEMEPTHQSIIDSFISPFRLAISLEKISHLKNNPIAAEQWLKATVTVIMHSGKFELGPDRFNEARFLFIDFIKCLQMNEDEFVAYEIKQQKKSKILSLFEHRKDFVCKGVRELKQLLEVIRPDLEEKKRTAWLVKYFLKHTRFPLVNESFDSKILFNGKEDESVKRTQKWQRQFGKNIKPDYQSNKKNAERENINHDTHVKIELVKDKILNEFESYKNPKSFSLFKKSSRTFNDDTVNIFQDQLTKAMNRHEIAKAFVMIEWRKQYVKDYKFGDVNDSSLYKRLDRIQHALQATFPDYARLFILLHEQLKPYLKSFNDDVFLIEKAIMSAIDDTKNTNDDENLLTKINHAIRRTIDSPRCKLSNKDNIKIRLQLITKELINNLIDSSNKNTYRKIGKTHS